MTGGFDPQVALDQVAEKYATIQKLSAEIDTIVAAATAQWVHDRDSAAAEVVFDEDTETGYLQLLTVRNDAAKTSPVFAHLSSLLELTTIVSRFTEHVPHNILEPNGYYQRVLIIADHLPRTTEA